MKPIRAIPLDAVYDQMHARFGFQHWWPGETPFEVCVGAILVQNTNWNNVKRVIASLKEERMLDPWKMLDLPVAGLAVKIRSAGYPNVKASRLRSFLEVLTREYNGDVSALLACPTPVVRQRLLHIHGIGPETADSMLLYAGEHLSFVVDAYTRRIFERHGWCAPKISYSELQSLCVQNIHSNSREDTLSYWRDFHAQFVMVGKTYCRKSTPNCTQCPLRKYLPVA